MLFPFIFNHLPVGSKPMHDDVQVAHGDFTFVMSQPDHPVQPYLGGIGVWRTFANMNMDRFVVFI